MTFDTMQTVPIQHNMQTEGDDLFVAPLIISDATNPEAEMTPQSPQHLLSTNSDQTASIIAKVLPLENAHKPSDLTVSTEVPPPPPPNGPITNPTKLNPIAPSTDTPALIDTTASMTDSSPTQGPSAVPPSAPPTAPAAVTEADKSRWTKDNRVILKQLMGSLPPHDIGAALRVILDTFGVESSKLVRRGQYVELDLQKINDDYILDSLWNYCAQMQYNIMNTLQAQQQQQIQQQLQFQQMQQQVPMVQMSPQQMMQPVAQTPVMQQFIPDQTALSGMLQIGGGAEQFVVMEPPQMVPTQK